jgi:hypothetical protein
MSSKKCTLRFQQQQQQQFNHHQGFNNNNNNDNGHSLTLVSFDSPSQNHSPVVGNEGSPVKAFFPGTPPQLVCRSEPQQQPLFEHQINLYRAFLGGMLSGGLSSGLTAAQRTPSPQASFGSAYTTFLQVMLLQQQQQQQQLASNKTTPSSTPLKPSVPNTPRQTSPSTNKFDLSKLLNTPPSDKVCGSRRKPKSPIAFTFTDSSSSPLKQLPSPPPPSSQVVAAERVQSFLLQQQCLKVLLLVYFYWNKKYPQMSII